MEAFSAYLRTCVETGIADGDISLELDPQQVINTVLPLHLGDGLFYGFVGGGYDVAAVTTDYIELLQFRYGTGA